MKKFMIYIAVIFILGIIFVDLVLAQNQTVVASEDQVVKMISNIIKVCPDLTQKEIFDKLQNYSKNINPNVATFIGAMELCQDHYLRYGNNAFLLDGKDISTLCTQTEITQIKTQIGNLVYAGGDIKDNIINQNNSSIWANLFWSEGTIGGIIIAGMVWLIVRIILFEYKKRSQKNKQKSINSETIVLASKNKEEVKK